MVPPGTENLTMKKPARSTPDVTAQSEAPLTKVSKLDQVLALLRQPQGASLAELRTATGWQSHSVRGALAGALKRKGHVVTSGKVDHVRRYRIGAPA